MTFLNSSTLNVLREYTKNTEKEIKKYAYDEDKVQSLVKDAIAIIEAQVNLDHAHLSQRELSIIGGMWLKF